MMSTTSYLIRFSQSMCVLAALSTVMVTGPLIIASPAATERTFYVSPAGNDANLGTESAPWQTNAKVTRTLAAGETAIVMDWIYD